ncbi:MAG: tRNA (adenosine(37)-N6)-threonylcarbamoyltransferase complex ATPase subunit type 1 TsaE [Oscillospiraceae bacterium]|nr:tRNA (adenosine(37)-N6)-threonylcarbamoyltransferase complex ATPase subunit type 1 TsaE [Oscillospiraceae bacterium]
MTVVTNSPAETEQLAATLADCLAPGMVLAFTGDLGAGKTTFTRGLARGLGIETPVTSPTYTIVNEYDTGRLSLIHFDMYRLSGADELFEIGWEDYRERGAVLAIEWSETVAEALGPDTVMVQIEKIGDESRRITITGLPEAGE